MNSDIRVIKDIMVVRLKGELDHHSAFNVKNQIESYLDKVSIKKILFDFKDINFMDSSGVGMIIGRYKTVQKRGGKIGVVNLSDRVKKIFEMSGLFNLIPYFSDEKEAFGKLRE